MQITDEIDIQLIDNIFYVARKFGHAQSKKDLRNR